LQGSCDVVADVEDVTLSVSVSVSVVLWLKDTLELREVDIDVVSDTVGPVAVCSAEMDHDRVASGVLVHVGETVTLWVDVGVVVDEKDRSIVPVAEFDADGVTDGVSVGVLDDDGDADELIVDDATSFDKDVV
jgi:hypothetical protein